MDIPKNDSRPLIEHVVHHGAGHTDFGTDQQRASSELALITRNGFVPKKVSGIRVKDTAKFWKPQ
jgi:hypothetical protein